MIKGVDELKENPPWEVASELAAETAPQPTVLVPMSAEDFERRRRRIRNSLIAAAVVVIAGAGWVYKVYTDPVRARESYDAGQRLFKVARYAQAILAFDSAIA